MVITPKMVKKTISNLDSSKASGPDGIPVVVLKNFELVRHLDNVGLFSDFHYSFRSSRSLADLLTVVTERIARTLNLLGATRAIALDISRVCHNDLHHKLRAYGVTDGIFQIISSFLSGRRLKVVLDSKLSPEFAINAGVPQGSILGPILFLLFINDLPDIVLSKIAIYADDTTLYCSCDKASGMWKQVEMSSGLESDLRDTVEWDNRWLVSFNARKTQLVSFAWSFNMVSLT